MDEKPTIVTEIVKGCNELLHFDARDGEGFKKDSNVGRGFLAVFK